MSSPEQVNPHRQDGFALVALSLGLLTFGIVMLLTCIAYAKDINTLAYAPFAIWNAVCGVPSADPLTMPILLLLSVLSIFVGIVLLLIRRLRASAL